MLNLSSSSSSRSLSSSHAPSLSASGLVQVLAASLLAVVAVGHAWGPVGMTVSHLLVSAGFLLCPLLFLLPVRRWDPHGLMVWGVLGVFTLALAGDLLGHALPALAAEGWAQSQGPALLAHFLPLVVAQVVVLECVERVLRGRAAVV